MQSRQRINLEVFTWHCFKGKGLIQKQLLSCGKRGLVKSSFFGGLIQKFALGGLATKNKVGFAILDPDQGGPDLDAKVTRAQVRGAVSGTDAQKKALDKELSWPSKNYKVARQGLSGETSENFYNTIAEEATKGVGVAASRLSSDLGLGPVTMPEDAKKTMQGVIRSSGSQMGALFEDVARVMDNRGPFKPAPPGAPFDFKNGIQGALKDNYNRMPSSFVDARTSYDRSNVGAAQGKIVRELAQEYMDSSSYKNATTKKKGLSPTDQAAADKRKAKQQARMAKGRKAAGFDNFAKGGAAPSDNVPALLTPGEFVFSASSAKKIGYSNLNRMNKQGVQGYASGGVVSTGQPAGGRATSSRSFYGDGIELGQAHLGAPDTDDSGSVIKNFTKSVGTGTKQIAKNTKESKDYTSVLSKLKDKSRKYATSIEGFAGRISKTASAAQSFVFLGASVGAVTSQMSSLDDATKSAINETAGFAAGIVGIGATVVETLASVVTSAAAEKIASDEVTKSKMREAAASGSDGGDVKGAGKIGKIAGGFVAGVALAVTALKFFSAKNKAVANGLKKQMDDAFSGIKDGTRANADAIKKTALEEISARNRSTAQFSNGAIATASTFALAGAAIGSIVPGVGTAVGALVGGLAGGAIGAAVSLGLVEAGAFGVIDAQAKERESIFNTIDSIIALNQAQRDLAQGMSSIDMAKGLSETEVVEQRLEVQSTGPNTVESFAEASAQLEVLAKSVGKTSDSLVEADFEGNAQGLQQFQLSTSQANESLALADAKFKETSQTFSLAMSNADPSKTFDELRSAGGQYSQALSDQIQSIKNRTSAEIIQAQQALKLAVGTDKEVVARENLNKVIERGRKAEENTIKGAKAVQNAKFAEAEAIRKSIEAQIALRRQNIKTNQFFAELARQSSALKRQSTAIDNFSASLDGAAFKFEEISVDEIGDIANVKDIDNFASQLAEATKDAGPQAAKFSKQVLETAKVFKKANEKLLGQTFSKDQGIDAKEMLESVGLTPELLGGGEEGKKLFAEISSDFLAAAKDGISVEELDAILQKAAQASEKAKEAILKVVDLRQLELDNLQKSISAQDKLRQKEIQAREAQIDAIRKGVGFTERAYETLAKSIDPNADFTPQRGVETRLQNINAQNKLDTLGAGLRAGDTEGLGKARADAQKRQSQILIGLKSGELKVSDELIIEQSKLKNIINATGDELKRLSDRSSEASDIQSAMSQNLRAIEKERAARQQVTGVIEEFVVGGKDARKSLVQAAAGVRQAFSSGTLQGQSPEQRQATVGLLDRLGDVQLAGGMTGKDIKKQLVFQDAIKLGLDPKIAESIANGTSTEEKLIEANKALASKMEQLTVAMLVAAQQLAPNQDQDTLDSILNKSRGGPVYRSNGGSIFKPKGTDTVPAMLSPGEFVIRKSAVDAIGADNLAAMNDGGGVVAYRKTGSKKPEGKLSWLEKALGFYERKPGEEESESSKAFKKLGSGLDLANVPKRLGVPEGGMFDGKSIAGGLKPYGSGPSGQELMNQRAGFQAGRDADAKPASTGNPLLDQFGAGTAGGAILEGLPDVPTGNNYTSSEAGNAERAAALRASENAAAAGPGLNSSFDADTKKQVEGSFLPKGMTIEDVREGLNKNQLIEASMQPTAATEPQTMSSLPTTFQGQPVNSSYLAQYDLKAQQTPAEKAKEQEKQTSALLDQTSYPKMIADAGFDALGTKVPTPSDFIDLGPSDVGFAGGMAIQTSAFAGRTVSGLGDAIFSKGEENIKAAERHRKAMIAPSTHVDASTSTSYLTKPLNMLTGPELKQRNDRIAKNKADKKARDKQAQDESLERGVEGLRRKAEELQPPSRNGLPLDPAASTNVNANAQMNDYGFSAFSGREFMNATAGNVDYAVSSFSLPDYLGGEGKGGDAWKYGTPQGLVREAVGIAPAVGGAILGVGDAVTQSVFGAPPPDRPETAGEKIIREKNSPEGQKKAQARADKAKADAKQRAIDNELSYKSHMETDAARRAAANRGTFMDPEVSAAQAEHDRKQNEMYEQDRIRTGYDIEMTEGTKHIKGTDEIAREKYLAQEAAERKKYLAEEAAKEERFKAQMAILDSQLEDKPTAVTYTDRQLAVMGRSSGFFGSQDDGVSAIGKYGLGMQFDDEGVLGDPSTFTEQKDAYGNVKMIGPGGQKQGYSGVIGTSGRLNREERMATARQKRAEEGPSARQKARDRRNSRRGISGREERKEGLRAQRGQLQASVAQERQQRRDQGAQQGGGSSRGETDITANTYQRLLRTSGPKIAGKYASRMNYTPPGPIGSPRSRKQSQQQIGGSNTDQLLQQLLQQMLRQGGGNRGGITPRYNATGGSIVASYFKNGGLSNKDKARVSTGDLDANPTGFMTKYFQNMFGSGQEEGSVAEKLEKTMSARDAAITQEKNKNSMFQQFRRTVFEDSGVQDVPLGGAVMSAFNAISDTGYQLTTGEFNAGSLAGHLPQLAASLVPGQEA